MQKTPEEKKHPDKEIKFKPSGRGKAQCPSDPAFPNGKVLDISQAMGNRGDACTVELPYPAPECGAWMITCLLCEMGTIGLTAAGRPDDPISVRIPCGRKCTRH